MAMHGVQRLQAQAPQRQHGGGSGSQEAIDPNNLVLVASVINTTNPYMASMIEGAQALGKKLAFISIFIVGAVTYAGGSTVPEAL